MKNPRTSVGPQHLRIGTIMMKQEKQEEEDCKQKFGEHGMK